MHKIVFSGKMVDGADPTAVKEKVARLFRLHDRTTLERLFSGEPVVALKNLAPAEARKVRDGLRKAGALCRVEPPLPAPRPAPPPPAPDTGGLSLMPTEEEAAQTREREDDNNPFAVRDLSTAPADPGTPTSMQRAYAAPKARTAPAREQAAEEEPRQGNSSGRPGATLPAGAGGLSWGGFFLNWIWGIGNNTWIALLALLPVANIIVPFWLLFTGREKAWQNRRWRDLEHFNRVQRNWGAAGLVIVLLTGWFSWSLWSRASQQAEQMQSALDGDEQAFEQRLQEVEDPRTRENLRRLRETVEEAQRQQQ